MDKAKLAKKAEQHGLIIPTNPIYKPQLPFTFFRDNGCLSDLKIKGNVVEFMGEDFDGIDAAVNEILKKRNVRMLWKIH